MKPAPVQPHQRIHYLDVLRGFAITGVLIAYVFWNLGTAPQATWTRFEKSLDEILSFIIDSKCFTILANLFAFGFVMHMSKSDDLKKSIYTYRKRLAGLMILGLIHAVILRNGDILLPYALLMLIVSFFYRSSVLTIIIAMIITFVLQNVVQEIYSLFHLSLPQRPAPQGNHFAQNFEWVKFWWAAAPFFWETTLLFLFSGLLLGKYFAGNKNRLNNRQLVLIAITGAILGALGYWIVTSYQKEIGGIADIGKTFIVRKSVYTLLWLVHGAGLAASYASILHLLVKRFSLNILAILGRMSLTNYLLQAVIVVPFAIGLDLFDHITPLDALIITGSIWIFQCAFSFVWLKHYRFGPVEWLLRRFTYGKSMSPNKIDQPDLIPKTIS